MVRTLYDCFCWETISGVANKDRFVQTAVKLESLLPTENFEFWPVCTDQCAQTEIDGPNRQWSLEACSSGQHQNARPC